MENVVTQSKWWRRLVNNWKTEHDVAKEEPHWKLWVYSFHPLEKLD